MGRKKKAPNPGFVIAIDQQEKKPFAFWDHPVEVKHLTTGDYSIVGLEERVCIERKSHSDAYGTFGSGRSRFSRELERMLWFDYAAIVIECTLEQFLIPPGFSHLNPKSAINSLVSWSVRYGVHVFFAGRRRHARTLTFRILEKYWKHHQRLQQEG